MCTTRRQRRGRLSIHNNPTISDNNSLNSVHQFDLATGIRISLRGRELNRFLDRASLIIGISRRGFAAGRHKLFELYAQIRFVK